MTWIGIVGLAVATCALLALNVPIAVAIGVPTTVAFLLYLDIAPEFVAQYIFSSFNSFPLVAIPFFILTSQLLIRGGLAQDLVDLANLLVARFFGGLGMATVVASAMFSSISGSSVACVMAVGGITIKGMTDAGYDRRFATGLVACAGTLGILIPPSITLILYGVIANVSIAELFAAGLVPGILVSGLLMAVASGMAVLKGVRRSAPADRKDAAAVLKKSGPALSVPLLVLGGIYAGVWTPTEAAAAAVFAALFVGTVIRRTLTLRDLVQACLNTVGMLGLLMLIFAFAQVLAFLVAYSHIPASLAQYAASEDLSRFSFFVIVTVVTLVAGQFMPAISILVLLTPIFLPVAKVLGIDFIHFGIVFTLLLEVSFITPPVGLNCNVAASISGERLSAVFAGVLPFGITLFIAYLLLVMFPTISLTLPRLLY